MIWSSGARPCCPGCVRPPSQRPCSWDARSYGRPEGCSRVTLGPFLFAAGIQTALDALPSGGALHIWYLDDGIFMGSVTEVEGVLTALQHALSPLGL